MIYATATVPVNSAGQVPLSLEQMWKGLVRKARDAREFLPPGVCEECRVIAEGEDFCPRSEYLQGTSDRDCQLRTHKQGVVLSGEKPLREDDGGELQLRFYCILSLKKAASGSVEEKQEQKKLGKTYTEALATTLQRTRALVTEGKL